MQPGTARSRVRQARPQAKARGERRFVGHEHDAFASIAWSRLLPTWCPSRHAQGPTPAQAAAARLAASRPTPVRGGVPPAAAAPAAAVQLTPDQLRERAAQLKQEALGRQPAVPTPGIGAANRLGALPAAAAAATPAGKKPIMQNFIPGMEPVTAKPKLKPAAKQFNLQEQTAAFPVLGQAADGAADGPVAPRKGKRAGGRMINALNPTHANGFVSDLDRYNALLAGATVVSGGDDVSDDDYDEDGGGSVDGSQASLVVSSVAPSEVVDYSLLCNDQQLFKALFNGLEAAGLGPEFGPYIEDVRVHLDPDYLEAMRVAHQIDEPSAEEAAEADRLAYAEAERIVFEMEKAEEARAAAAASAKASEEEAKRLVAQAQPAAASLDPRAFGSGAVASPPQQHFAAPPKPLMPVHAAIAMPVPLPVAATPALGHQPWAARNAVPQNPVLAMLLQPAPVRVQQQQQHVDQSYAFVKPPAAAYAPPAAAEADQVDLDDLMALAML